MNATEQREIEIKRTKQRQTVEEEEQSSTREAKQSVLQRAIDGDRENSAVTKVSAAQLKSWTARFEFSSAVSKCAMPCQEARASEGADEHIAVAGLRRHNEPRADDAAEGLGPAGDDLSERAASARQTDQASLALGARGSS